MNRSSPDTATTPFVAAPAPRAGTGDRATAPMPERDTTHLLVIEDDTDSVRLIVDYLRDFHFAVSIATGSSEGLAKAGAERPDLILLDLFMPEMDGFQVLTRLKGAAVTRAIPVLLLTASDDVDSKVRGFGLGAADYLTKPVAEAEVHARIMVQLHRRQLQSALEERLRAYEDRFGALDDTSPTAADHRRNEPARHQVEMICRARRILLEQLASPPSLEALARAVGTNQPRLSRGFRLFFGTTVYGFIREARSLRARELLLETNWPIKTIALELGYSSASELTRYVRKRFGMTPSQLRNAPFAAD